MVPPSASQILDPETTIRLQETAANVFVHHALVDYVVRVINATRRPAELGLHDVDSWLSYGASPRATLGIVAAARALALVRGRDYVIPADIVELIPDVLRHRLVLSYDALADEVTADQIINRILQTIGLPQVGTQPVQQQGPPVQAVPGQPMPGQPAGPQAPGVNGAPGQNPQQPQQVQPVNGAQGRYPAGLANQTSARYGG